MFRSIDVLFLMIVSAVLASCASTAPLTTPTPPATPTVTIPTFNVQALTPPPGTMQCAVSVEQAETESSFSARQESDHWFGASNPAVTILLYYDLECPYCGALHPILKQLADEYPQQVQIIYRQFPAFMVHEKALLAAQALEAVSQQDNAAYFPMIDAFYRDQSLWVPMDDNDFSAWLLDAVLALGLDRVLFENAMTDTAIRDQLVQQLDADLQNGVTYTPFLLINGQIYPDIPRDLNTIRSMTELALLETHQFSECPPPILDKDASYTATLHTEKGDIIIQLLPDVAPQAVNNFLFLTQQGWYGDIPFYRVIHDSYALSGDPSGTGLGNPGYTFNAEIDPVVKFDRPGVVAMNNTGAPDTNGSNFFITYQAMPALDGAFTIFGQVIEGMDVLLALTPRDPISDPEFIQADRLLSVTIQQQ